MEFEECTKYLISLGEKYWIEEDMLLMLFQLVGENDVIFSLRI